MANRFNTLPVPITRHTPHADLPEWVTPTEAQLFLGVGKSAITNQMLRGELPSKKFGHFIRIPKAALRPLSVAQTELIQALAADVVERFLKTKS